MFYKELLVCKKHIKHARMYALRQYKKNLDFLTISFRISVWENIKILDLFNRWARIFALRECKKF